MYSRLLIVCISLIAIKTIHGDVEVELSVLQYDNPLGMSYTGMNITGGRKCCDNGGSDCNGGKDTCDVYFYFCIGSLSYDPSLQACDGASIDMSQKVSTDVFRLTKMEVSGLKRFSSLTSWELNATRIDVNAYDIDEIKTTNDTAPVIQSDLIDTFSQHLNLLPSPDYWSSPLHVIQFRYHISMAIGLRVWCSKGWYGPTCEKKCTSDDFHVCRTGASPVPLPECSISDTLVLALETPLSQLPSRTLLQKYLVEFLANTICPKTTQNISLSVDFIREYSSSSTEVISHGHCDDKAIARLKFQQAIYVMNQVNMQLESTEQQFGSKVTSPRFSVVREAPDSIAVMMLLRIIRYENLMCAQGANNVANCNPVMKVCFPTTPICTEMTVLKTKQLTDCNGDLVDLSSPTQTRANAHNSTMIVYLQDMRNITLTVSEFSSTHPPSEVAQYEFSTDKVTVGRNFLESVPVPYSDYQNNNTTISIEVMAWCSSCHYGDRCQFKNSSSSCNAGDTTIAPDCKVMPDCHNGGVCFNETCICEDGWTGPTCNVDFDECSLGICSHADTCTNTPGGYTCTCSNGFNGTNCEQDIDECNSFPCHNGYMCLNTYGSFVCICMNATVIEHCDAEDYCTRNPCLNNATCINSMLIDNFTCTCPNGWIGTTCETNVNECNNGSACQNGGTCHDTLGGFSCQCGQGWTGVMCETDQHGCETNPCQNKGNCKNSVGGNYTCECLVGWLGYDCDEDRNECLDKPCLHEAKCQNNPGSYRCECLTGWKGTHCEDDKNECNTSYACNLNGNCTNTEGGFSCRCFTGWSGEDCSVDINECVTIKPCKNGGHCTNLNGSYTCSCPTNWTGKNCTSDVSECINSPCQHGGSCSNTVGSYTCTCVKGWTGSNCTKDVDECLITNPCTNGGICKNIEGTYSCECPPHWTGSKCQTDVNECQIKSPCQNNGTCINTIGGYTCNCLAAWTGKNCSENVNECLTYTNICQQHGVCTDNVGGYECSCINGYMGTNCSNDINECLGTNPCNNGGVCENVFGSYKCNCTKAWMGLNCTDDVNECEQLTVCNQHGVCVNSVGSYDCKCTDAWHGPSCNVDTNECLNNPCHNTGDRCINTEGSFSCNCTNGWQGNLCDININDCVNVDCQQHGRCQDLINDYKCICQNGFSGKDCEININDCIGIPCKNGGNCHDQIGYFDCVCPPGWNGQTCENDVDECTSRPCSDGKACYNTAGSYTCKMDTFTRVFTTSYMTTQAVTGPVDIFSLQFTNAVAKSQLPKIRQGIEDILRLLTCHDAKSVSVSLVNEYDSNPNTVEFHAQCDARHMTNSEFNTAIRTLSAQKLASYFPVQLENLHQEPEQQSWIASNILVVAGGGGGVALVLLVILTVCIVKRKRQVRTTDNAETDIVERLKDMDGTETITINNPVYNSLYPIDIDA